MVPSTPGFGMHFTSDSLKFVASPWKALLIMVYSICLVSLGVWLKQSGWSFLGWLTIVFFGLGVPLSLLMLLPNATYLRLDEEGFEMRSVFRNNRYRWTDVAGFTIGSLRGAKMIAIHFRHDFKPQRLARSMAAALAGMEGAIPNHYNAPLEEILEALNAWRQRYGRKNA